MTLSILAIIVMIVDARFEVLVPVRHKIAIITTQVYSITNIPSKLWDTAVEQFSSHSELLSENERLKAQSLLLEQRLQKLASITQQNARLRELLNSASLVDEKAVVSELIGIDPNPTTFRYLIDKGSNDGVFVGQSVLDATGVMGQVVDVTSYSAWVILITDTTHSIPVMVNRNGLRAIASGTGEDLLEIRYVPNNEDIKVNDLLVSSGLGGNFPSGYPVATVSDIKNDTGSPFATIYAKPTAALNRSRYVLLIFTHKKSSLPDEQTAPQDETKTSEEENNKEANK
ncbi:rod shape-determining protein MreC [Entomomonas moraniae]|uniref:rod shape-determining protein MreC n=1 Tax=Entomomonas moraniae TaxID=2213226 RepID=UPI0038995AA6